MPTINVQFSDSTETKVIAIFGSPQDPATCPNWAQVPDTDPRYLTYLNPAPTPASVVAVALAAGLAITSTGTPAIDGTYPLDSITQFEINSVMLFIQTNGDFPGGTSTYPWFDAAGAPHIFPSIAVFKEWATAVANYVAALKLYGAGAPDATLPQQSVTIA
jgi:hypothetical protein